MSVNTVKFRYACVCLIALISIACNSVPLTKEPTLMPDAERPSPSLTALLEPTLDNLEEEQTEQPQPTVHILGEPAIAPTVDVNTMNINLKQELYFTGGAETSDSLPPCTRRLFMKYEVSSESETQFMANGVMPSELKEAGVSPYFWGAVDDTLNLCVYAFPEDEIITIALHTPEGNLCASWDVRVSDYYYLTVGDITIVDFATDWPRCSHAGQWSVVVKSTRASVTESLDINWDQMAKLTASGSCDSPNDYVSVRGAGYPSGEPRFLGVYGACYPAGEYGPDTVCKLLQSYLIGIGDEGSFDVLVPANLPGQYIVVPVKEDEPPAGGFHFSSDPGIAIYPSTCSYPRDLYLTAPTLEGGDVQDIQQQLRALGYFEVGPVDGIFGPKTESAVLLFQRTNGLEASGIVEEATRDALFDDDAIPRPHERSLYVTTPRLNGDDVAAVQQRLVDLGYVEVGEVDGYYGPKTESAVLRFQKINGLPDSGMVDEQAWKVIFGGDAVPGW